jgi:hypothetical protein
MTNTLSAAKPSVQTFQLPVVKTSDEADHSKHHIIIKSPKSPPPTATKPK